MGRRTRAGTGGEEKYTEQKGSGDEEKGMKDGNS
jgi:hypothetical protein